MDNPCSCFEGAQEVLPLNGICGPRSFEQFWDFNLADSKETSSADKHVSEYGSGNDYLEEGESEEETKVNEEETEAGGVGGQYLDMKICDDTSAVHHFRSSHRKNLHDKMKKFFNCSSKYFILIVFWIRIHLENNYWKRNQNKCRSKLQFLINYHDDHHKNCPVHLVKLCFSTQPLQSHMTFVSEICIAHLHESSSCCGPYQKVLCQIAP